MSDEPLPTSTAEPHSSSQSLPEIGSDRIKLIIVGSLIFVIIGNFIFPVWWWDFLFEGGFANNRMWYGGIGSICQMFLLPFLAICTVLYLEPILLKQKSINLFIKKWLDRLRTFISKRDRYIILFLIAILIASLITLDIRSKSSRIDYEKRVSWQQPVEEAPLAMPVRFIFLSEKVIDSLYKQREDSLAIAKVTEEVQASKNLKGEFKLSEILRTDAERSEAQKKSTEYQATKKTPEQQLKDLLEYLHNSDSIPTYRLSASLKRYSVSGQPPTRSGEKSETQKLDEAIQFIERYNLSVDQEKLRRIRSRLLAREIKDLESNLRDTQGQILVNGNWLIDLKDNSYIFRSAFVEKVSDSPICEFKLPKSAIIPESRLIISDIMNSGKNRPIKLEIFGSITSGITSNSGKVTLDPIAVYLP